MRKLLIGCFVIFGIAIVVFFFTDVKTMYWNSQTLGKYTIEKTNLYMDGILNSNTYTQIKNILDQNPQIDTLILVDVNGSIDSDNTMDLGYLIRERGLNTHLMPDSSIVSGGVDLFIAGMERTMEGNPRVGVHSWGTFFSSVDGQDLPTDDPAHEIFVKYHQDMLGDDEFYWFTLNTAPSSNYYYMTEREMRQYGLLTR